MQIILITGISGFLGRHFAELTTPERRLIGFYHRREIRFPDLPTHPADLTDEGALRKKLEALPPLAAVIHLAAVSNPNSCEEKVEAARRVNVDASIHLARYCAEQRIPFLFASTDLIFDGERAPYAPEDQPEPVNEYGRQKVAAEQAIRRLYPAATIARLPLMYGAGANFMPAWLEKLRDGQPIHAFTDEYRTAAYAGDVARGLLLLLDKGLSGNWHLGGPERISRYDFAVAMARAFELPEHLVRPSRQADVKMPAQRPADVSLDSEKANACGYRPEPIQAHFPRLRSVLFY